MKSIIVLMKHPTKKIAVLMFFIVFNITFAQWEQCNGPYGGTMYNVVTIENCLFGSSTDGVFFSDNFGQSWILRNIGLSDTVITDIISYKNDLYLYTSNNNEIYKSTDKGLLWNKIGSIDTSILIVSLVVTNDCVLIGTLTEGIFATSDNGKTWESRNNGIEEKNIFNLYSFDNMLYAITVSNFYISSDNGNSWKKRNSEITDIFINCMAKQGNNLILGTIRGIYISSDEGVTWKKKNNGINDNAIFSIFVDNNTIYAGNYHEGVYISTDNGNSWNNKINGLTNLKIKYIFKVENTIYVDASGSGLFKSTDQGKSWKHDRNGLINTEIEFLDKSNNKFLACSRYGPIYISNDKGLSWEHLTGMTEFETSSIYINGKNIYANMETGILISTDSGNNWFRKDIGPSDTRIECINGIGSTIIAGTNSNGLYISTDEGNHWLQSTSDFYNETINLLYQYDGKMIAVSDYSISISLDTCKNWNYIGYHDKEIKLLTASDSIIYIARNRELYWNQNMENKWNRIKSEIFYENINTMVTYGNYIIIGTDDGIYYSSDKFNTAYNIGFQGKKINSLISDNDLIVASTGSGVYRARLSDFGITGVAEVLKQDNGFSVYSNPYDGSYTASFVLGEPSQVTLELYDYMGRRLEILAKGYYESGRHEIGININCSPGFYFFRLNNGKKDYFAKSVME